VGTDRPRLESHPCALCGSRRTRPYAVKFDLGIVSCRRCGLVYAEPRLGEEDLLKRYSAEYLYGEYLPVFRADRSGFDLELVRGHYALYLALAGRVFAPGKRLLDVGCGPGFFLKAAAGLGWEAEGVEISPSAAEYAAAVLGVPVRRTKLEEAGFPEAAFDVVTMLDAIEHLGDPSAALAVARRVLKPGGRLILNTPDLGSASRRVLGTDWGVLTPAEHLTYFTGRTLRRMLERAGFDVFGIRNLLRFDPDCTHAPDASRRLRWKRFLERSRIRELLENAHRMEYTDLLTLGPGIPAAPASVPAISGAKRRAVRAVKRFVRGDTLVAVAAKS